jgi:predicted transcriptional regulator
MPPEITEESPREREILEVIYAAGPSSVSDVRDKLANPPGYSAVRTMLTRLVAKGFLRYKRDGQRYVYSPRTAPDTIRKLALKRVIRAYFGGSLTQAVSALLDEHTGSISSADAREIQRMLAAARKRGSVK